MAPKTWLLLSLAFAFSAGCAGSCGKGEDTSSQQSPQTASTGTSTIHVPRESHPMRLLMDASAPPH